MQKLFNLTRKVVRGYKNISPKTQAYIDSEAKTNCQNYAPIEVVIAKGEGAYLWDVDGKRYIDCVAAYSALNQGHMHPRIKKAFIDQLDNITLTSRAVYNDKLGLATDFLTKTFDYDKAILMNSGVEAGETAIKFARKWAYVRKGVPDNQAWVLFAKNNFWGRTIAACGSSNDPDRYEKFGPFEGLNFKIIEYNNLAVLENEFKTNKNIAAYYFEPVQGEGGVIIPDKGYLKEVRRLCDKYNVLMICDEIQTGLGRTGTMLCQDHENVKADMVCLGKALSGGFMPVSAVLGTNEVFDCIKPGMHGSTYGGNPLACVTAIESIKVLQEENMVENSKVMGERLVKGLAYGLKGNKTIKDVRGLGLFVAVEVKSDSGVDLKKVIHKLLGKGVLCKQTQTYTLRLAPPLIITKEQTDEIIGKLVDVLNEYA